MPVHQRGDDQFWILETDDTAYTIGVDKEANLRHTYWGRTLPYIEDYPAVDTTDTYPEYFHEEAAPWGGVRYKEPAFKITFYDATRVLELDFTDAQVADSTTGPVLSITLEDPQYDVEVRLSYRVLEQYDVIERTSTVTNECAGPITLEQAYSAQFHVPYWDQYRLTHLCGGSQSETQRQREPLTQGKKVIESRRGITSHQHNPWFAIDDGTADETQGEVYYGGLAYSGNWKFVFEHNDRDHLVVSGGINDFDFSWHLEPGESFTTPQCIAGYTSKGFGGASRTLHEYQRRHVLPDEDPECVRPVVYASWYATKFELNTEQQKDLANQAASLGIELFELDDGWFGDRDDDTAGLGDWVVNETKFPNGLAELVAHVHDLGMEFSLWVEPEMVNPDSELYRNHPDWVYHFPSRPRSEMRNQLILNLAKEEVYSAVHESMDRLLTEYDIDMFKWDMNRRFTEPGWPDAPTERQREIWVRHTNAVYDLADTLQADYPEVRFEFCAGGGGRVDMGIFQRAHQMWISDNVDPYDRLAIQTGYSHAYTPKTMMNWVIDYPTGIDNEETEEEYGFLTERNTDLAYEFHVAMNGLLGVGADLTQWSDERKTAARELISQYKEIRPVIQNGDQYRLRDGPMMTAVQYVSREKDLSVVLAFLHAKHYDDVLPPLRLRGLDERARYRVDDGPVQSGTALAERGIDLDVSGCFESRLLVLEQVGPRRSPGRDHPRGDRR
jgi:alpha-galactosidase